MATKTREPLTKKIRFEVFKRDGFACQYCGKHPPETTLEVDHIKPVSDGGSNDINNLITSCFDCNRGKRDIGLNRIPSTLIENKELLFERENQYLEYVALMTQVRTRIDNEIDSVCNIFLKWYHCNRYTNIVNNDFRRNTVKMFIEKLDIFTVTDAMERAVNKISKIERSINYTIYEAGPDCLKYFCGICWNKIKEKGHGRMD